MTTIRRIEIWLMTLLLLMFALPEAPVMADTPLVISSLSAHQIIPGAYVTVTGNGFGSQQGSSFVWLHDNGVNWGAPNDLAHLTIIAWSNSSITFQAPEPSGNQNQWALAAGTTATLQVVTSTGTTNTVSTDVGSSLPVINHLSTTVAGAGQTVTLSGENFGTFGTATYLAFHDNGVNWGTPGNAAPFHIDSWSNTQITFTVPAPSGPNGIWAVKPGTTASVTVANESGTSSPTESLSILS